MSIAPPKNQWLYGILRARKWLSMDILPMGNSNVKYRRPNSVLHGSLYEESYYPTRLMLFSGSSSYLTLF